MIFRNGDWYTRQIRKERPPIRPMYIKKCFSSIKCSIKNSHDPFVNAFSLRFYIIEACFSNNVIKKPNLFLSYSLITKLYFCFFQLAYYEFNSFNLNMAKTLKVNHKKISFTIWATLYRISSWQNTPSHKNRFSL